jgi:HAD superfamily hydrolase (TIGR01509 family)
VDDLPGELKALTRLAPRCVVLDAMGVIFAARDDVAELLVPFVRAQGGAQDSRIVESAYLAASLGEIDPDTFWQRVGLAPDVEPAYLRSHRLTPGALEFLAKASAANLPVWCLSNDVARWSKQIRRTLAVEPLLTGAVISSDAHIRKPDRGIYERLLAETGLRPSEVLFVDDRESNVRSAAALGIRSIEFEGPRDYERLSAALFGSRLSD